MLILKREPNAPENLPLKVNLDLLCWSYDNRAGCNVAINYANSTDRANKFVNELKSTYPKLRFAAIQADVGLKSACEELIEKTICQLGGLDIIVSNAGCTSYKQRINRRVDTVLPVR